MEFPITRMRRLRKNPKIRKIIKNTNLNKEDLIYPIFVTEDLKKENREEIKTMPDEYRYSLDAAVNQAKKLEKQGLYSILLFGIPSKKDEIGSSAFDPDGIVQKAIRKIKDETDLIVISDVCLCEYTSHGHCGLIEDEKILNDESLISLAKTALSHAEAGADIIAPSDMMDGRVGLIREILDDNGYEDTIIMSYSAKYASSFYAPFRDAVQSAPSFGDRKSYQMDPSNNNEVLREVELDIIEGADIIMIKPALPYLDIINSVKLEFNMPLAAYSVSGEYSMIKAGISEGYLTEESIFESILSIKRAGADLIITNFTPYLLELL